MKIYFPSIFTSVFLTRRDQVKLKCFSGVLDIRAVFYFLLHTFQDCYQAYGSARRGKPTEGTLLQTLWEVPLPSQPQESHATRGERAAWTPPPVPRPVGEGAARGPVTQRSSVASSAQRGLQEETWVWGSGRTTGSEPRTAGTLPPAMRTLGTFIFRVKRVRPHSSVLLH